MKFTVPIRVRNGQNERLHWAVKAKRARQEKAAVVAEAWLLCDGVRLATSNRKWRSPPRLPVTVSLTRIYTRQRMDIDGNVSSLKHVQDAVAELLGIDDGDEDKVTWKYSQQKGDAYAVVVQIEEVASEAR